VRFSSRILIVTRAAYPPHRQPATVGPAACRRYCFCQTRT
jgi:hypothetical protein